MASLAMTKDEREKFLADLHVGIISIADPAPNRAPLAVPIWYDYDPKIGVWILTGPDSLKGKAIKAAGRFTMTAQTEDNPYRYVMAEGPVIEERLATKKDDLIPMAARYSEDGDGEKYAENFSDEPGGAGMIYVMRPERWLTVDYSKMGR